MKKIKPQDMLLALAEDADDPPLMLVYFIEGGHPDMKDPEGLMKRAVEKLENEVRPALPPPVLAMIPEGSCFHITVCHDDGCPAQETRDEADCTCMMLTCEAMVIDHFQTSMLEATGMYDKVVDLEHGTIRQPSDDDAADDK